MNRTEVIQSTIDRNKAKIYLEIGVAKGVNFIDIIAPIKIAVDPNFRLPENYQKRVNERFFETESDKFFEEYKDILGDKKLDVVFIDGLHTYEQSLKDVLNSLKHLNKNGVIIMHDCNPQTAAAAHKNKQEAVRLKLPGWQSAAWNGDVYKTIINLRSFRKDLNIFTLDCDHGLGIITKGEAENMLNYNEDSINNIGYDKFKKERKKLINLKKIIDYKYFYKISIYTKLKQRFLRISSYIRGIKFYLFNSIIKYKFITLSKINEKDILYIKSLGMNIEYLLKEVSTEDRDKLMRKGDSEYILKSQRAMIKNSRIDFISPFSGKILSSTESIYFLKNVFYKFIDKETFYLIFSGMGRKCSIFFPKNNLVINLFQKKASYVPSKELLNYFKFLCLKDPFFLFKINKNKKNIIAIIDFSRNIGHHLWDNLTGLNDLIETGNINFCKKLIIACPEPYGKLEELFPEIPREKIVRKNFIKPDFSFKNSDFYVKIGARFLEESLVDRIKKYSFDKSSKEMLDKTKDFKDKHFPIVWVTLRVGVRSWLSQVSGLVSIINKLKEDFPNIGVIINGFAIPEFSFCKNKNEKKMIDEELNIARKIISSVRSDISILNVVGCKMCENIVWCDISDFYISPWGALLVNSLTICNKPGVIHSNTNVLIEQKEHYILQRADLKIPLYIDSKNVVDFKILKIFKKVIGKRKTTDNYECDWMDIYKKALCLCRTIENNKKEK